MNLTPLGTNMTEIEKDGNKVLFSYKTPVASYQDNVLGVKVWFVTEKKWSSTTTRHINKWLALYGITKEAANIKSQEFFDKLEAI